MSKLSALFLFNNNLTLTQFNNMGLTITRSLYLGFKTKDERNDFVKGMNEKLPDAQYLEALGYFKIKKGKKIYEAEFKAKTFKEVQNYVDLVQNTYMYKKGRVFITHACLPENEPNDI